MFETGTEPFYRLLPMIPYFTITEYTEILRCEIPLSRNVNAVTFFARYFYSAGASPSAAIIFFSYAFLSCFPKSPVRSDTVVRILVCFYNLQVK
jgi:hypothetical protein